MQSKLRVASVALFLLLSLFFVAFGALYATVKELLWFHAAALPAGALDDVRPLYFALMKLIGGSSAALGLLGGYVALGPLRRGAAFAAEALALAYALPVVMAAVVAETLAAATGAPTSWRIMGVLLAVDAAAYLANLAARRGGASPSAPQT
jgi:hypothetical protein